MNRALGRAAFLSVLLTSVAVAQETPHPAVAGPARPPAGPHVNAPRAYPVHGAPTAAPTASPAARQALPARGNGALPAGGQPAPGQAAGGQQWHDDQWHYEDHDRQRRGYGGEYYGGGQSYYNAPVFSPPVYYAPYPSYDPAYPPPGYYPQPGYYSQPAYDVPLPDGYYAPQPYDPSQIPALSDPGYLPMDNGATGE